MADKTWKQFERRIAAFFGTRRTPLSGRNSAHGTASDSLDTKIFIEAKHKKRHTVHTLWEATKKLARKEGKIPVLALHEKGKQGALLVVHQDDFERLVQIAHERSWL